MSTPSVPCAESSARVQVSCRAGTYPGLQRRVAIGSSEFGCSAPAFLEHRWAGRHGTQSLSVLRSRFTDIKELLNCTR
jgi:hypothetical protein